LLNCQGARLSVFFELPNSHLKCSGRNLGLYHVSADQFDA